MCWVLFVSLVHLSFPFVLAGCKNAEVVDQDCITYTITRQQRHADFCQCTYCVPPQWYAAAGSCNIRNQQTRVEEAVRQSASQNALYVWIGVRFRALSSPNGTMIRYVDNRNKSLSFTNSRWTRTWHHTLCSVVEVCWIPMNIHTMRPDNATQPGRRLCQQDVHHDWYLWQSASDMGVPVCKKPLQKT